MRMRRLPLLLPLLALAASSQAAGPAAAPFALVPGGGALALEADDQDGNRLMPSLFTWTLPAGVGIGVQETATGWLISAPLGAPAGSWGILVQYNPNPALSPTAMVSVGKAITAIKIVVSPAPR